MAEDRTGDFFGRFWRGDIRLPVMFWFWGVLVPAVVQMVGQVPFESGDPWFMFTYGSAVLVAVVFWVVGTWRSATKYRKPAWGVAAKVYIVVGFMVVVFVLGLGVGSA